MSLQDVSQDYRPSGPRQEDEYEPDWQALIEIESKQTDRDREENKRASTRQHWREVAKEFVAFHCLESLHYQDYESDLAEKERLEEEEYQVQQELDRLTASGQLPLTPACTMYKYKNPNTSSLHLLGKRFASPSSAAPSFKRHRRSSSF